MLVVLAVLAMIVVGLVWAWATGDHGEPEQAHRVLIIGGTPTDLVDVIHEAGFEARQISWLEAKTECTDPDRNFDGEAVIEYADEHGYGFVALMLDDDMLFESTILGESAPKHALAAVISIGELARTGSRVHFGEPPTGEPALDYVRGARRSEALRMGLYEHPDLLALWIKPTSSQLTQQVQLAKLADARTLLSLALARYQAASEAWPSEWPSGSIVEPWTETEGLLVHGGRVVSEVPLKVRIDEQRKVALHRGEPKLRFVPGQGAAITTEFDAAISERIVTPDGSRVLLRTANEWQIWRFDGGPPQLDGQLDLSISSPALAAEQVWFEGTTMVWTGPKGRGELTWDSTLLPLDSPELGSPLAGNLAWLAEDVWVVVDAVSSLEFLELPQAGDPRLVALPIAELHSTDQWAEFAAIYPSAAGLFVLIRADSGADTLDRLIHLELDLDLATLRSAMTPILATVPGEPPTLDEAVLTSALRTLPELGMRSQVVVGLPSFVSGSLVIAPDGTWMAWQAPGRANAIWAAAIHEGELAAAVRIGESLATPQISADSQTVLLTVERELPELGSFHHLRRVARPSR